MVVFFTVAMLMLRACAVAVRMLTSMGFFAVGMIIVMAILLVDEVRAAQLLAVVMGVDMIMATMVFNKQLIAWLFAVVMSMSMVMASMLFCNLLVVVGLFAVAGSHGDACHPTVSDPFSTAH